LKFPCPRGVALLGALLLVIELVAVDYLVE
jgi:hypothetical protein